MPKSFEVWFVSQEKSAQVIKLLEEKTPGVLVAYNDLTCEKIGDKCFDPQVGLYEKRDDKIILPGDELGDKPIELPQMPTASSIDRNLISCDPNNKFDLFCGKAKPIQKRKPKLEIWVDTSSSMKDVDVTDEQGDCFRRSFIRRLDGVCGFNQGFYVSQFDTSKKETGSMDTLCETRGLNNQERLAEWIADSEAEKLIVITDIYELFKSFTDFIDINGGEVLGDKQSLTARKLLDEADRLVEVCQQKSL